MFSNISTDLLQFEQIGRIAVVLLEPPSTVAVRTECAGGRARERCALARAWSKVVRAEEPS